MTTTVEKIPGLERLVRVQPEAGTLYYEGVRDPDGTIHVWFINEKGRKTVVPHIALHSPTGFNWGYGGSGPADLALALTRHALGEKTTRKALREGRGRAIWVYQDVKWQLVGHIDVDLNHWYLPVEFVRRVAQARETELESTN